MLPNRKWFIALSACLIAHNLQASVETIFSTAKDPSSDRVLFTAKHTLTHTQSKQLATERIEYFNEKGHLIAEKEINYHDNPIAPTFTFQDHRIDKVVKVERNNNEPQVDIWVKTLEKAPISSQQNLNQNLVIDRGFNGYIQRNWQSLLNRNPLEFDFLLPDFDTTIRINLSVTALTKKDVTLKADFSNVLHRIIADPIILTYDRQTKRLLRYQGLTQLKSVNEEGNSSYKVASIEYEYR